MYIVFFLRLGIVYLQETNYYLGSVLGLLSLIEPLYSCQNKIGLYCPQKSTGSRPFIELLRSFTKIRKSKGPSREPWGTPHLTIFISF